MDFDIDTDIVTCPKCGYKFSLAYGRTFACQGCSYAATGSCGYARCPRCGHEFPLIPGADKLFI